MTLKQWADNGWLTSHKSSAQEIGNLLAIVERDIKDASKRTISADWRFGIAYNAALKLCTILLYAEGYRAERNLQHYRTIQALPLILGQEKKRMQITWTHAAQKGTSSNTITLEGSRKKMRKNSLILQKA